MLVEIADENDVNEQQIYVIQQTEVSDLLLQLDETVAILVMECVCIDLQATEHLLL